MKLLHTSDWHLGARLGRVDRAPDHREALRGLLALAEAERPDLILHTGDLFDAYRPPHEALQHGVRALGRLARLAPTVVLSGNHDSPQLFRALDELAGAFLPRRLWFVSSPHLWTAPDAAAHVVCVPFVRPGAVVDYTRDDLPRFEGIYADGIRTLSQHFLAKARQAAGPRGIVLYAAHLHVEGARPGKSERTITVGDDYATHLDGLDGTLYCAFGHIHDPQLLPGGLVRGRYAGSLIPLDFGEREQTKQAILVTIGDDAGVEVDPRELPGGRPLVDFSGTLDELERRAANGGLDGSILKARVVSEDPIPDLGDRLREWSPGCAVFDLRNPITNQPLKAIDTDEVAGPEPEVEELFLEWRGTRTSGLRASHAAVAEAFREARGAGPDATPDFGLSPLETAADETLDALAARRRRG